MKLQVLITGMRCGCAGGLVVGQVTPRSMPTNTYHTNRLTQGGGGNMTLGGEEMGGVRAGILKGSVTRVLEKQKERQSIRLQHSDLLDLCV